MRHQIVIHSTDIVRATEFYWNLFGVQPTCFSEDIVWFDVPDPELYLTIKRCEPGAQFTKRRGVVWLETSRFVVSAFDRIEAEGMIVQDEASVGCYYPCNNRLWVRDMDGNRWNFFVPELAPAPAEEPNYRILICLGERGFFIPDAEAPIGLQPESGGDRLE